jgi:hypothetical protein
VSILCTKKREKEKKTKKRRTIFLKLLAVITRTAPFLWYQRCQKKRSLKKRKEKKGEDTQPAKNKESSLFVFNKKFVFRQKGFAGDELKKRLHANGNLRLFARVGMCMFVGARARVRVCVLRARVCVCVCARARVWVCALNASLW